MSNSKVAPVDPDASVCASMQISPLYVDSHATVCCFVLGLLFFLRLFYIKEKQTGLSHLTHPHWSNTMKPLCREGWCGIKCSLCKPSHDFVSCQTIDIIDPSDPPALVISNWLNINSLPEVQCYNGSTFIIIIIIYYYFIFPIGGICCFSLPLFLSLLISVYSWP